MVKVITRPVARTLSGKDAEGAQAAPHLARLALRLLVAPGVLGRLVQQLAVQGQVP